MRLLIFKVNQLGDNIVFLPVVQWLDKLLPGAEISILTSPLAAPLYKLCRPRMQVIEEPTSDFNRAWKSPRTLLRLRCIVRDCRPDACLVANDQGNVAHLLAWMSGAEIRVGPRESKCRFRGLLTRQVPLHLADPVALQDWRIAQALLDDLCVNRLRMPDGPPPPEVGALRSTMASEKRFVLIHPGASRAYKRWPMDRYVELANRLCEHVLVEFVQLDDGTEALLDARIHRVAPEKLPAFFELMGQAALFIGNNSGPMHIASVLGVPGLIFAGPSAANWKPMWHEDKFTLLRDAQLACQPCDRNDGPVNRCLNLAEPMACMNRLSVDLALRAALDRLGLK